MSTSIIKSLIFLFLTLPDVLSAQKVTNKPITASFSGNLKSNSDSVQYALGAYLAQWIINNGFMVTGTPVFLRGMDDILKNKPRQLTDSTFLPILTAFQKDNQKKIGKSLEEQLFMSLKDKPGIGKLPSGVQFIILKAGKGPRPQESDSIMINLKGALANGTLFEDTFAKKVLIGATPFTFIPGLSETIQLMPLGSMWEIYVPAALAYGDQGNGTIIPPNSALIYIIELVEIKGKKT